jgi:hypothetical protein
MTLIIAQVLLYPRLGLAFGIVRMGSPRADTDIRHLD